MYCLMSVSTVAPSSGRSVDGTKLRFRLDVTVAPSSGRLWTEPERKKLRFRLDGTVASAFDYVPEIGDIIGRNVYLVGYVPENFRRP